MGQADQPLENALRGRRVVETAIGIAAVPGGDVVTTDGAPEHVGALTHLHPALDPRKQALDPWAVAAHAVRHAMHRGGLDQRQTIRTRNRNQVFGARQEKHIRLLRIQVLGQPLVRLALDGRQRKVPTKPEGTVSSARVIAEAELGTEAAPPWADRDRHRH